jgi:hypothetical protein
MKWFDKWFAKKCKQAWEEANTPSPVEETIGAYVNKPRGARIGLSKNNNSNELQSRGTNFMLFKATGGYVVELRTYNPSTDEYTTAMHVIPTGKSVGKAFEHILTIEALKR